MFKTLFSDVFDVDLNGEASPADCDLASELAREERCFMALDAVPSHREATYARRCSSARGTRAKKKAP